MVNEKRREARSPLLFCLYFFPPGCFCPISCLAVTLTYVNSFRGLK